MNKKTKTGFTGYTFLIEKILWRFAVDTYTINPMSMPSTTTCSTCKPDFQWLHLAFTRTLKLDFRVLRDAWSQNVVSLLQKMTVYFFKLNAIEGEKLNLKKPLHGENVKIIRPTLNNWSFDVVVAIVYRPRTITYRMCKPYIQKPKFASKIKKCYSFN